MSDQDAAWLYPGASPDDVLEEGLRLGPTLVALTLGHEGAILANAEHRVWFPAVHVDAADTIGAGDTFMASLVRAVLQWGSAGLGRGPPQRIGEDAVRSSAITVSRPGADLPGAREL